VELPLKEVEQVVKGRPARCCSLCQLEKTDVSIHWSEINPEPVTVGLKKDWIGERPTRWIVLFLHVGCVNWQTRIDWRMIASSYEVFGSRHEMLPRWWSAANVDEASATAESHPIQAHRRPLFFFFKKVNIVSKRTRML